MRVHPEVACEHEIQEELLRETCIVYEEAKFSEQLNRLAVNGGELGILDWQGANDLEEELEEARQLRRPRVNLLVTDSCESQLEEVVDQGSTALRSFLLSFFLYDILRLQLVTSAF